MRDPIVIQNLQRQGFNFDNVEDLLRYEAVERKPRFLDKEPKRIAVKRAEEAPEFGCKQEFILVYNEISNETNGELFTIDLNRVKRYCDREVFIVLQTLIRQGVSYNKEIATACYDMFRYICTAEFDTVTKERVYQVLQPLRPVGYYGKQIYEALNFCLFGENPVVLYWKDKAKFNGLYKAAYLKGCEVIAEKCATEKDVDSMLRIAIKEAKADTEFMKSIYTQGISKELLGMLYLLKDDEDKKLLNPDSSDSVGWG